MQKKIWLSALDCPKETVQLIIEKIRSYGLDADGHFFEDDSEKMTWIAPRQQLLDPSISMWLLAGSAKSFNNSSERYGIAMLTLAVQAQRGPGFPVVILQTDEESVAADDLPTPLSKATVLSLAGTSWPAKLVAAAHKQDTITHQPYRLDVYADQNIGQWFEIGPKNDTWKGAIFGVSNGEISLHAVGTAGQLPEKSILNYPQQGLKISCGNLDFTAWGVQNELSAEDSYYLKVEGCPEKIMFCPYSSEQETEAFILSLK